MEADDRLIFEEAIKRIEALLKEVEELTTWLSKQKLTTEHYGSVFFIPYHGYRPDCWTCEIKTTLWIIWQMIIAR